MSQMACSCGARMSNTTVPCPTEGSILREQDFEAYWDKVSKDVALFIAAIRAGRREEWIKEHFPDSHAYGPDDADVVNDLICNPFYGSSLSVWECPGCGRLWVQRAEGENQYLSYSPDHPGFAGVLRSKKVARS